MFFSPLAQFDVVCVIPFYFFTIDLSFTNLVLTLFLVLGFFFLIFYLLFPSRLIYRTWQILMENIFLVAFRILNEQIGKNGLIYFPFIFSLFTFILLLNLFSLMPYGFAVTSHLIWTMYFSLSICLGIFFIGIYNHGILFLRLFVPEVPLALYPLMIVIEILSYIIRSFSLAIRLSANIIAGHTLVHILAQFILTLCSMKKFIVILPYFLIFAIFVLEFGVAFLQAYIFVTLVCMYLNDSVNFVSH